MSDNLKSLCKQFIDILETVEVSDNGREFHPTTINSCRVLTLEKLDKIIADIKKEINYE